MMLLKYGRIAYLWKRIKRLGVPLTLGIFTVSPAYMWIMTDLELIPSHPPAQESSASPQAPSPSPSLSNQDLVKGRLAPIDPAEVTQTYIFQLFPKLPPIMNLFSLHYLWFLWYLLLISIAIPALIQYAGRFPIVIHWAGSASISDNGENPKSDSAGTLVWSLALGSLPFWLMQKGWSLGTPIALFLPFPLFALHIEPAILGFYTLYFLFGWWLHRHIRLLGKLESTWKPIMFKGLSAFILSRFFLFFPVSSDSPGQILSEPVLRFLCLACTSVACAHISLGLIGLFHRYFNKANARWRYLADAALWLYLSHMPLVFLFQFWMRNLNLPWFVHLALVTSSVAASLLLVYQYLIHRKWIGRNLLGQTIPPSQPRISSAPTHEGLTFPTQTQTTA